MMPDFTAIEASRAESKPTNEQAKETKVLIGPVIDHAVKELHAMSFDTGGAPDHKCERINGFARHCRQDGEGQCSTSAPVET